MKIKTPRLTSLPKIFLGLARIAVMYISLFLLFFFDSGFYPVLNMQGTLVLLVDLAAIAGLIIASGVILKIKKRLFFFYVAFITIVIVSGLCFSNIKQTTIVVICITIGFAVVNFLTYERFVKIYKEMMLFLSVFSLFTLALWFIAPSVITALPVARQTTATYYNAIFSIVSSSTYSTRNIGMFWEPGAYAIFLNIALLFEMTDKKQSLIKMLIFMLTIVTTLSTLGIICLANLVLVYIFGKEENIPHYKRNKFIVLAISVATAVYIFYHGDYFIYHVFGKLTNNTDSYTNISTSTRINAIIYPFKAFKESPFVGVGLNEFLRISREYCDSMATCTFLNWLAIYGIFGLIFVIPCVNIFLKHGKTLISKIGLLIFAVLLFSTEAFLTIGFVYILVFYGIQKNNSPDSKETI